MFNICMVYYCILDGLFIGFAAITAQLARLMKEGEQELVWTWKHRKIV